MRHGVKNNHHDSKNTSWCQTHVMTSKRLSWHQKVRHDFKKFIMASKSSSWSQKGVMSNDVKKFVITWLQKHVMTPKRSSWHPKHVKKFIMAAKTRHDAKKFGITGCNLGSEKFWLLGRNSLRWEGVQPKLRNLSHSQYMYRGVREWSGLCHTSADIYHMYYFENWLLAYGACVCVSVCVNNINLYVF